MCVDWVVCGLYGVVWCVDCVVVCVDWVMCVVGMGVHLCCDGFSALLNHN